MFLSSDRLVSTIFATYKHTNVHDPYTDLSYCFFFPNLFNRAQYTACVYILNIKNKCSFCVVVVVRVALLFIAHIILILHIKKYNLKRGGSGINKLTNFLCTTLNKATPTTTISIRQRSIPLYSVIVCSVFCQVGHSRSSSLSYLSYQKKSVFVGGVNFFKIWIYRKRWNFCLK